MLSHGKMHGFLVGDLIVGGEKQFSVVIYIQLTVSLCHGKISIRCITGKEDLLSREINFFEPMICFKHIKGRNCNTYHNKDAQTGYQGAFFTGRNQQKYSGADRK